MKIYVALAYWCEDTWVCAAGHDRQTVDRDAKAYCEKHNMKTNEAETKYLNPDSEGRVTDGYSIEEIEEAKP